MKILIVHVLGALLAALLSSLVPREVVVVIPGNLGCAHGCTMAAAGWPFVYLVDHEGISPVGSVSLLGVTGEDHFYPGAFGFVFFFWLGLSSLARAGCRRWRRRGR